MGNPGPFQGRQRNHNGVRAGAYNREATPPHRIQTNKGKKFFNSDFQAMMSRHGIQHLASKSEQKAAVVEQLNRTIKTRIWTYFSDPNTVRKLDVIQDLVDAYNHSGHGFIGMAPADVQNTNENRLWVRLFGMAIPTSSLQFRKEPWCKPVAKRHFFPGLHAKLDQGAVYSESNGVI